MLLLAAAQILVTVLNPETGMRLSGLGVEDFSAPSGVEAVSTAHRPVAALLLVDTSVAGEVVRKTAERLVATLGEGDQLAIQMTNRTATAFSSAPALESLRYDGDPRIFDGLSAALDVPFPDAGYRKVIVLLTAGIEGPSRTPESAVIQKARGRRIAIYPIYLHGSGRWVFDGMARETGGAPFWLLGGVNVEGIWDTIRRPYQLTLKGAAGAIKAKGREKTFVSTLPLY